MQLAFHKLIYFHRYRLRDRRSTVTYAEGMEISEVKRKIDGLYPTLEAFIEAVPICFLKFRASLVEVFDAVRSSEATTVRTLTAYLEE